MDISSVLMGILLLMLFIAPLIYIIMKQSSGEKSRRKKLMVFSETEQVFPDQTELLNSVSLGLDTKTSKLAVIQQIKPTREFILDLKEHQSCQLEQKYFGDASDNSLDSVEEIGLLLISSEGFETEIIFYHDEWDSASEKEACLAVARKWQQILKKACQAERPVKVSSQA